MNPIFWCFGGRFPVLDALQHAPSASSRNNTLALRTSQDRHGVSAHCALGLGVQIGSDIELSFRNRPIGLFQQSLSARTQDFCIYVYD